MKYIPIIDIGVNLPLIRRHFEFINLLEVYTRSTDFIGVDYASFYEGDLYEDHIDDYFNFAEKKFIRNREDLFERHFNFFADIEAQVKRGCRIEVDFFNKIVQQKDDLVFVLANLEYLLSLFDSKDTKYPKRKRKSFKLFEVPERFENLHPWIIYKYHSSEVSVKEFFEANKTQYNFRNRPRVIHDQIRDFAYDPYEFKEFINQLKDVESCELIFGGNRSFKTSNSKLSKDIVDALIKSFSHLSEDERRKAESFKSFFDKHKIRNHPEVFHRYLIVTNLIGCFEELNEGEILDENSKFILAGYFLSHLGLVDDVNEGDFLNGGYHNYEDYLKRKSKEAFDYEEKSGGIIW